MEFPELLDAGWRPAQGLVGQTFSYARQYGEPHELIGVFDAVGFREQVGEVGFVATGPQLSCRLEDLRAAEGADYDPETDDPTITKDGVAYRVRDLRLDGMGLVTFWLAERGA